MEKHQYIKKPEGVQKKINTELLTGNSRYETGY
jgi:hypothetical protein